MKPEDYYWRAYYSDGEIFEEHDQAGQARSFATVDLSRLVAFEIVGQHEPLHNHLVQITPGVRPIFFRRRSAEFAVETGVQVGATSTITCLGYQKTDRGRNTQVFVFHFPDGSSVITDDRDAVH